MEEANFFILFIKTRQVQKKYLKVGLYNVINPVSYRKIIRDLPGHTYGNFVRTVGVGRSTVRTKLPAVAPAVRKRFLTP